jgi:hypothetical protein
VGDGPGNTGDGQGEQKEIGKLLAKSH